jgi:peptidoglycan/xylan/chitin deacetylase (PgdA/CDA1 family)
MDVKGGVSRWYFMLFAALLVCAASAEPQPVEVHQVLVVSASAGSSVAALTLDACDGGFNAGLIEFLIENRIAATIFATKKWLDHNPQAVALLKDHFDLFDIENHGANHIPAVIGTGREVYGIPGELDVAHLKREVRRGAAAVAMVTGAAPHWYRGATGEYDAEAISVIEAMGYKVAGFSVNADDGATLSKRRVMDRLKRVRDGDIIIAHLNRPESDSAAGLIEGLKQLRDRNFRFVKLNESTVVPAPKSVSRSTRVAIRRH